MCPGQVAINKRSLVLDLARAVREYLVYQSENGLSGLPAKLVDDAYLRVSGKNRRNPAEELRRVKRDLGECGRCRALKGRRNVVFGDGDPFARLMFIGEAPGEDEDAQGVPFVGKAGRLLTDIIEKGMKLKRTEVYITNILKCRPPDNRDPAPEEIKECLPVLKKQIAAVRPRVIVTLGRVAAQTLLDTAEPISRLRGQWREYAGIPVMPTYHPSYLLRTPDKKRETWEDVKQVMEKLGLPIEESK